MPSTPKRLPTSLSFFRRLRPLGFILSFIAITSFAQAPAKRRTALVIGNTKYEPAAGALRNTGNDAKAVAKTLRSLGFEVIERHNVNRDQLLRAVMEFRKTLAGAEVGLFYYAGHGISVSGANYLIPLKSGYDPEGADQMTLRILAETRLFNVEQAVADMSAAGAQCNLVILDACRTTALARNARTRDAATRGGLSEMTPPAGSLIAFATDAGQTAFDGDGINGLYTEELLKHMRTPGLTIEQVFKRTRAAVLKRSGGNQLPAEYSRLVGDDIYLAGEFPPKPAVRQTSEVEAVASSGTRNTSAASPSLTEIATLAASGNAQACVAALRQLAKTLGPGDYAANPINRLLEHVKENLKDATVPSPRVEVAAETCELILQALPECLPSNHPQRNELTAKAHNRRGDALVLLGRPKEAVAEFDAALPLSPDDPYILYNRGRAYLALGLKTEAKADFTAVLEPRFKKPMAKRLAQQALAELR